MVSSVSVVVTSLVSTVLWLVVGIPLVLIVGIFFLIALKILRAGRANPAEAEEAKLIQDIYHGLRKMEERVEALETILLEKERAK